MLFQIHPNQRFKVLLASGTPGRWVWKNRQAVGGHLDLGVFILLAFLNLPLSSSLLQVLHILQNVPFQIIYHVLVFISE